MVMELAHAFSLNSFIGQPIRLIYIKLVHIIFLKFVEEGENV
jgi:hypothetical protein